MSKNTKTKKKENNKYLIIAVVVLSICTIVLGGYIVYDEYLRDYFLYRDCKGCNPDTVAHIDLSPIEEMEDRLDEDIPVLNNELDYYILRRDNKYGRVDFNSESFIEIAKDFNDLDVSKIGYLSVDKEKINSLDVSIYSDSNGERSTKAAVWKYKDFYYGFTLDNNSSLDFNKCVEELIKQVVGE